MDSTQNNVGEIEKELENTEISKTDEDHDENIDTSAFEIPTFGFTEKSWRSDFAFIVEGTRLYVNKTILSLSSPVFDAMFQSSFKESSCDELELPEKKLRDVVDFLRYIYPGTLVNMSKECAFNVLPLVEEYQVLHLKRICEDKLLENVSDETPVDELFRILQLAYLYSLDDLRQQCVEIASKKTEADVDEAFEKCTPPAEVSLEIFKQMNAKLRETVLEQKQLIDDMSRQATENNETLKATIIDQEGQLDILKQYLSADVKKNEVISLGKDSYWRDTTIILDVDIKAKDIKSEREIIIWNIPLVLCVSQQSSGNVSNLNMEIRNKDQKIKSKLKGRVIVVNRQPQGGNEIIFFDGTFSTGNIWYNRMSKNLMTISKVTDIANGYLQDGHIGIIVQICMSEPNRG